ncbi:radical SAM protein [Sulfolobus sp. A20]|uniref:B12-binding domain-containing radical SAM protein n=1 Tax=Sulfolobaceae TaxID=118883 RepID=UPI000845BDD6|nr:MULTISPECIES: radical SAM protein [unclassified Sulfolobus]TRM75610.1 radical SAM protein [Sulfolobus sp. E5]TRM78542.1 radical SAM protein [Sulfolobus sp. A20-N-F8]TRM79270.1 radical SAM protein [Sulfolobus sp. B5]TRM82079.1 radical SAM protein [Sulfolobus sp. D5]TRM82676.1 radical SAM protein [Sulfolobus sp. A20-N-F6]TRM95344.1 radical SAM protein [Sulfolobus sp. A20-N-G8]TRN02059.1 radical SAM protein [Sulfolobus sp. F1]TRN03019.1 radical SAM protein [Sulfolobus sp. E1]
MAWDIILTADKGSFTDYGGSSVLGYVACMPSRLVPRAFMDKFFTPNTPVDSEGKALYAPYALRKVESVLVHAGFSSVAVVPPERLGKVVDGRTRVVGLTVHDPFGLNPVSFKLSMIFGGGSTWTAKYFEELGESISKLKGKYGFKVVAGGPGAWELVKDKPNWIDVIYIGDAEGKLPEVMKKLIDGEEIENKVIYNKLPKSTKIPPIINPARLGEVQITRGCPRGCQFCSITPETFISIPIETIKKEIQVNMKAGTKRVEFITDDVLLYGSQKLRVNHEAIVKLFSETMNMGVDGIWFPHISAPAVKSSPQTVKAMSEIARYDKDRAAAPVVGLESGSERIISKYMRGKPFPWTPREWGDVIIDATAIMNDNYIYPCYTMTIGYLDETDEDVDESIKLVESIIDHGLKAWIFPLVVIPMGTSYIKDNPFPIMEKLPSRYWDLLYISWKYDLKITREMIPILTGGIKNKFAQGIVKYMIDRVFDSIEWVFLQLKETKGRYAYNFSNINLNNTLGVIKSIYWLFRLAFKPL